MLRLWDYKCISCGKVHRDHPVDGDTIPKTIACDCGKRAGWTRLKKNLIHRSISSLYGKTDPRFGERVDSYEEKKRLLKEHGLEETEVEKYDDIQNDIEQKRRRQAEKRGGEYIAADSIEEVYEQIEKRGSQISWKETGNLRGRTDQDPETGLISSQGGF